MAADVERAKAHLAAQFTTLTDDDRADFTRQICLVEAEMHRLLAELQRLDQEHLAE